ncbi:MAG: T9SS type A sorting domain-containing protein [Saprospiraceae bacterium]
MLQNGVIQTDPMGRVTVPELRLFKNPVRCRLIIEYKDTVSSTTEPNRLFRVYPNPVSDWLTVESAQSGTVTYEISGMHGNLLRTGEIGPAGGRLQISFAAELPGVYLLRLREQGGAEAMVRVVKM